VNNDLHWHIWLLFLVEFVLDGLSVDEVPGFILTILLYFKLLLADLAEVVIFLGAG